MKEKKKLNFIPIFYFILLFIFIFGNLFISNFFKLPNLTIPKTNLKTLDNGWIFKSNDIFKKNLTLPNKEEIPVNQEFSYSNVFPSDKSSLDIIAFQTLMMNVKLEIDGKIVLDLNNDEAFTNKAELGNFWFFYKLKEEDYGKNFTLHLISSYKTATGYLPKVYTIKDGAQYYLIFKDQYINFLFILIYLLLSFVIIFISYFIIKDYKKYDLLYLGITMLIFSLWLLSESKLFFVFFKNTYIYTRMAYNAIAMIPASLVMWLDSSLEHSYKKITKKYKVFVFIVVILSFILSTANIMFIRKYLLVSHILMLSTVLLYFVIYLLELFKNVTDDLIFEFSVFLIVFLFIITELIIYYSNHLTVAITFFTKIGALSALVIVIIKYYRNITNIKKLEEQKRYLSDIAYKDHLTGAYNRTAFNEDILKLKKDNNYIIVNLDCNNLKYVNDNLGHLIGDQMIIDSYNCIKDSFGKYGRIYRMGGDEFLTIITDVSKSDIENIKMEFYENVDIINKSRNYDFSISLGIAYFNLSKVSIDEAIKISDEFMYNDKKRYKSRSNS